MIAPLPGDDETQTATLHADRSIDRAFNYSYNFGSQSHTEGQFVSLAGFNPYTVAGATGKEKLTLYGDIMSVMDNNVTVKTLDTLQITNGTYGLDANFGNDRGPVFTNPNNNGGIHLSNIKNVDISGTVSAIYSDAMAKVELKDIDNLNLTSNIKRVADYGKYLTATADYTIYCDYGSLVDISAKNTTITSTGQAITAAAHNAAYINGLENASWETDYPLPVINIKSDTLTIAAATSGPTAAAVYSDAGATINLGSADKKIKQLTFVKDAGANMNLYSDGYIYEDKDHSRYDRYSDTIAAGKTADDYILHQSQINVYAEYAEFNANTNAINARNNALINVNAENAVINNNYGNVATVSSSGGSTVSLTGDDLAITNHNTNYLKDANVIDAKDAKVAIGSGGIVNPSRQDLVEDYGGTIDKAGDIIINANKKLTVDGNIIIDAKPATAAGNSISINKDNTTALVNVTGDIYTNNGNEVHLTLGDGSAAKQDSNATGRQAGRSTLTGAILDAASTATDFSFSDTSFSEKGTNLKMKDATWNVTADSDATTVDMAGSSIINLTHDHGFQKLKIKNLSGSGTIKAHNMNYYLWRDQSERLTKRLGITCFDEERAGVWTKMSNSSISGSGIYGSDTKVKTYTIGYDFKHNSGEQLTTADAKKTRDFSGLAFTYIKGSSSMNGYQVSDALQVAGGRSDIRGGALTAYHTHTSKSGSYADYVLRYSSYDNDFKLDGVNGSAKSHGLQASAEYGCRLENNHGLFVTPNAQFTLGRLYNKAFTTSDGVHVASDHLNSAILSMVVDVGQTLGDQSQVYAKVRYNTELGDRVSAAFYQGDASAFCNGDSNGSWWEYGLGFDLKAGHASHLFMDAERASGSGFSKDWSWRIGARFDF